MYCGIFYCCIKTFVLSYIYTVRKACVQTYKQYDRCKNSVDADHHHLHCKLLWHNNQRTVERSQPTPRPAGCAPASPADLHKRGLNNIRFLSDSSSARSARCRVVSVRCVVAGFYRLLPFAYRPLQPAGDADESERDVGPSGGEGGGGICIFMRHFGEGLSLLSFSCNACNPSTCDRK